MLGVLRAGLLSSVAFVKQSYADTVSALNPVAYWHLGELGGTTIVDEKAVQNGTYQGTSQGTVEFGLEPLVQNSVGTSLGFDGAHTYGQIPHNAAFATSNGTIAFAVQPNSVTGQHMLLAKDQLGVAGGFTVDINNGRLRAYLRNNAGTAEWLPDPNGAADVNAGAAYHVAFTWGSRGTELWLNGELVASNPGLTTGLGANNGDLFIAAYPGPVAFGNAVMDEIAFFGQQLSAQRIAELARPRSIPHGSSPSIGIQLPQFAYQEITDSVPAGAVWWDPTNGDDSKNGSSKGQAKKTFPAAEALASTSKRIIIAGGAEGSTTYHVVPKIVPTKSGTNANNRMELFAEPNRKIVLVRDGDFLGGINGSWNWTTIDATKKIYESPNLGIGDGATTVNSGNPSTGNNWIAGILEIPNGCNGRPHMMFIPWVATGDIGNTGGGNPNEGGYTGPCVTSMGNGKLRLRLQPITQAVAGNGWPTDGLMGGLIGPNGTWQEPSDHPNNYRLHLVRWDGDFGGDYVRTMFDLRANGVDWWHIKGVNFDLLNMLARAGGNTGILFENCTAFPLWCGVMRESATSQIKFLRCQLFAGDHRHLSWRAHKTSGYWFQHFRSALLFDRSSTAGAGSYDYERCVIFGWFDLGLPRNDTAGYHKFSYCALLNTIDDGIYQGAMGVDDLVVEIDHCFSFGGPLLSGGAGAPGANSEEWYIHHNVIDHRLPMLWQAYGTSNTDIKGICPNMLFPHSQDGYRAFKIYHNTFVVAPNCGKAVGRGPMIGTSDGGHNVPSGMAHEVYNNLVTCISSRKYPDAGSTGDSVASRISCQASTAGIWRLDYNLYFRSFPGTPDEPAFLDMQNSQNSGRSSYASLAAFRASAHKTTSHSMYSDGTTGHEQHGVEQDPQFVDHLNRDYRPQSAGAISGAKNLTATGWPGTGTFQNWKGALNPNGDGSEVGPQKTP